MTLYRVGPRGAQGAGLIIGEGLPPTDQEQLASYGLGSTWLNSATGLGYGPLAKVGIGGDVSFGTDVSLDLSAFVGGSTGQTQDQVLALILAAKAFQGNWEAGTYQSGSVVVNNDAVWLAIQETDTEANVDSGHWILIGGAGAGGGGDVDTDAVNALIATALDDFDLSTYALKPTLTAGAIVAPLPDLTGHIFGGHHYDYANNDTIQWNVTAQDGHTVWVVSGWPDQDSGYFGGLIPYDLDAHQWGEITPIPVPTGAPVYDPNAPLIWHGFRGGGADPGQESEGFTSPGWFSQLGSLALPDDWASVQLPEMIPGQKCWIRVQVLWPPAVFQHWLDNGGGPATDYPVVASSDIADFLAAPATSTGWCYFVTDGVPTQGQIDAWVNTIKTDPQYADISAMLALAAFQMVGHDPTNSTGAGEPWGFEGGVGGRIGRKLYFGGGDSNLFDDSSGVIDKDGNSPWSADYGRKFMSYDLDSGDFIDLPDIPVGVDWVFFGIADDKLYVVGTDNWDEDDDLLQVFDPSQGEVGEWSEPQHLNDLNPGNGVFVLHVRGTGQPGTYLFPWTGDGGQPGGGHAGVDYNIGLQVGRRLYWADYGVYMDLDTYAFSDCCDSIQMDGESTVVLDPDGVRIHRLGGYGHRVLDTRDNTWAAGVFATDARLHAWDSTATMAGFGTDGKLQVLTTDGVLKEVRVALDVMADPTQFIRFRDSSGTVIRAIGFDATDGHFHDYSVALNGTRTDQGALGVGGGDDSAAYISSLINWIQSGAIPSNFGDGSALISADNIDAGNTSGRHILNDRTLAGALNDADAAMFGLQQQLQQQVGGSPERGELLLQMINVPFVEVPSTDDHAAYTKLDLASGASVFNQYGEDWLFDPDTGSLVAQSSGWYEFDFAGYILAGSDRDNSVSVLTDFANRAGHQIALLGIGNEFGSGIGVGSELFGEVPNPADPWPPWLLVNGTLLRWVYANTHIQFLVADPNQFNDDQHPIFSNWITIRKLGSGPKGDRGDPGQAASEIPVQDTPPDSPTQGDLWVDTSENPAGGASEPLGRLALTNDWSTAATVPGAGSLAVYADFLNTVDINADGADGGDWVTVTQGGGDGGGSPLFVLAEGVYTIGLEVEQASNTGGTGSWNATFAHVAGPDISEVRVPVTSAHHNSLSQSWEQDEVTVYVSEGTGFVPVIHNGDAAATDFDWVGIWITKWS